MSPEFPTIYLLSDHRDRSKGIVSLLQQAGCQPAVMSKPEELFALSRIKKPDCVVFDLSSFGDDPLPLLAQLVQFNTSRPVLCASERSDLPMAVRAMKTGAFNFLLTSYSAAEWCQAIEEAVGFHRQVQQLNARQVDVQARYQHLTTRERQVFALIITGQPNKQIAATLGLAVQTVKIHRARTMAKMGAGSAVELLQAAQFLSQTKLKNLIIN